MEAKWEESNEEVEDGEECGLMRPSAILCRGIAASCLLAGCCDWPEREERLEEEAEGTAGEEESETEAGRVPCTTRPPMVCLCLGVLLFALLLLMLLVLLTTILSAIPALELCVLSEAIPSTCMASLSIGTSLT